jgi:hypothetical protein
MNHFAKPGPSRLVAAGALGAMLELVAPAVLAQASTPAPAPTGSSTSSGSSAPTPPAGSGPGGYGAPDPNPYYLGVSQAFTYDSNVYRVPDGKADAYSSTSLLGGFDQAIGRQRVFGRAIVSGNRYQDEKPLDNVSYAISGGADLATIENISGGLYVRFDQNLADSGAYGGVPIAQKNIAQTETVDVRLRWGGPSLLTLEGGFEYSRLDYSAPTYVTSETRQKTGTVTLYYRPGGPLRLGLGYRQSETDRPKAVLDTSGNFQPNTLTGKNVDLLVDYALSGLLDANARLSYTKQTNSSAAGADISGWTGHLGLAWQATAKTSFNLRASREAGFDTIPFTTYAVIDTGSSPVVQAVTAYYENSQVTDSVVLGVAYSATAKISASATLRYSKSKLFTRGTLAGTAPGQDVFDTIRSAHIGANYAITRSWSAACSVAHESRDVTGPLPFSYTTNIVGCTASFTFR